MAPARPRRLFGGFRGEDAHTEFVTEVMGTCLHPRNQPGVRKSFQREAEVPAPCTQTPKPLRQFILKTSLGVRVQRCPCTQGRVSGERVQAFAALTCSLLLSAAPLRGKQGLVLPSTLPKGRPLNSPFANCVPPRRRDYLVLQRASSVPRSLDDSQLLISSPDCGRIPPSLPEALIRITMKIIQTVCGGLSVSGEQSRTSIW